MSGVRGRSGRLPAPVEQHVLRGTHRVDRHGRAGLAAVETTPAATPVQTRIALRPPRRLRPETARWFRSVATEWKLEAHHAKLLALAAVAWDRCEAAREAIDRDGLTVKTARGGPRLNPLLRVEDASRRAFARLIQQLDLEDAPTPGGRR